jgi:hypothetical protein
MAVRKAPDIIQDTLREGINAGLLARLRVSGEDVGVEIAREMLQQPDFKAEIQALAREIAADLRKR